jgi:hypothetical protein
MNYSSNTTPIIDELRTGSEQVTETCLERSQPISLDLPIAQSSLSALRVEAKILEIGKLIMCLIMFIL